MQSAAQRHHYRISIRRETVGEGMLFRSNSSYLIQAASEPEALQKALLRDRAQLSRKDQVRKVSVKEIQQRQLTEFKDVT